MLDYVIYAALTFICTLVGAYVGVKVARGENTDFALKYAVAESELERLLKERDEARLEAFHLRRKYEGMEVE